MPAKKKQKTVPDKNQPTLVALLQKDRATEPSSETQDPQAGPQTQDTDAAESEKPSSIESNSDQSGSKKIRTFQPKWMTLYSWLDYDYENKFMFCKLCTEAKKTNGLSKSARCTNFMTTTLQRHVELNEHKMLVEAPRLRKDREKTQKKMESKQDIAANLLLRTVHFLIKEDIPFVKFKSFLEYLHDVLVYLGHKDLNLLKESQVNYDSSYTANEMLDCLSETVEDRLKTDLKNSPVVTALADESTDISNHKRLVIYTQIISEDMRPSTRFLTNIECDDASGKGIATSILQEFEKRGVQPSKIMSLGSDGASVMTGKINGKAF